MQYILLAIVAIIGGGAVGWTSASNMDNNPLKTPMIFHNIDPLFFVGAGLIIPAIVGYILLGFVGILVALVIAWLSSVVIGNSIHKHL